MFRHPTRSGAATITYIWAQGKWHYLAVVLDLCTRRVVGWALSEKPDADLVIKALDVAYEQRGRPQGLLFHSDQGSQGEFNRSSQHWIVGQILDTHSMLRQVFSNRVFSGGSCSAQSKPPLSL